MPWQIEITCDAAAKPAQTSTFEIGGTIDELILGTSARCDFPIEDDLVAKRHVRLRATPDGVVLENLDEEMGTVVDGVFVEAPVRVDAEHAVELAAVRLKLIVRTLQAADAPPLHVNQAPEEATADPIAESVGLPDDLHGDAVQDEDGSPEALPEPLVTTEPEPEPEPVPTVLEIEPVVDATPDRGVDDAGDDAGGSLGSDVAPTAGGMASIFAEAARMARSSAMNPPEAGVAETAVGVPDGAKVDAVPSEQVGDERIETPVADVRRDPVSVPVAVPIEVMERADAKAGVRVAGGAGSADSIVDELIETLGDAAIPHGRDDAVRCVGWLALRAASIGIAAPDQVGLYVRCAALVGETLDRAGLRSSDLVLTLNHVEQDADRRLRRAVKIAAGLADELGGTKGLPEAPDDAPSLSSVRADGGGVAGVERSGIAEKTPPLAVAEPVRDERVDRGVPASLPDAPVLDAPALDAGQADAVVRGVVLAEVVGEGPHRVYQAGRDASTGAAVLVTRLTIPDAGLRRRGMKEAAALQRMRSRGLEPIQDFGETDDGMYLVTPWPPMLDARGLPEAARKETGAAWAEAVRSCVPVGDAASHPVIASAMREPDMGRYRAAAMWTADIAEAVHSVHVAGACVPVLTLAEIRPTAAGLLVLRADALLACTAACRELRAEPPRLAPEWLAALAMRRTLNNSERVGADIWALGAVFFELAAGEDPFGEDLGDPWMALATGEPRGLSVPAPDAPGDLVAVSRSALARRPSGRPRTAATLAATLRSAAGL